MAIADFIKEYISKYNSPIDIEISNAGLKDQDMNELVQLINNNPAIKGINLSQNNIGDESTEILLKLANVKYLVLSQTDITNIGAIKLIESNKFAALDFSRNRAINDKTGERILALNYKYRVNLTQTCICNDLIEKINALQKTNSVCSERYSIFEKKMALDDAKPDSSNNIKKNFSAKT